MNFSTLFITRYFELFLYIFMAKLMHGQSSKQLTIQQVAGLYSLSEGPHWDEENNVLYFVDIPEQKVYCWNPETNKTTHTYLKNGPVGVAIPVVNKKNSFIVGCGNNVVELVWNSSTNNMNPQVKIITTVDKDRNDTRINDGKIDAKGRFWAGTMGEKDNIINPNQGSLYRFDHDGSAKKMVSPVSISNGLVWNDNNDVFYYIDSPMRQVTGYDFDLETGDISNKRTIFDFQKNNVPGLPDGMTIDSSGYLWVAVYDGGRVLQVDPKSGNLLRTVEMPATKITSVAFGGPQKNILFVTSAKQGLSNAELKQQPLAGSVFSVDGLGVRGTSMLACKIIH